MQHPDGHWAQNFYPDGRDVLERASSSTRSASRSCLPRNCAEGGHLGAATGSALLIRGMVERCARLHRPQRPSDRAGSVGGERRASAPYSARGRRRGARRRRRTGSTARRAIMRSPSPTTGTPDRGLDATPRGTPLARRFGVPGHYVRIAPDTGDGPMAEQRVEVRNRGGLSVARDAISSASNSWRWSASACASADDPRIRDTRHGRRWRPRASTCPPAAPGTATTRTATASTQTGRPSTDRASAASGRCSPASAAIFALAAGEDAAALPRSDDGDDRPGRACCRSRSGTQTRSHRCSSNPAGRPARHASRLGPCRVPQARQRDPAGRPIEQLAAVVDRYATASAGPRHWRAAVPLERCPSGSPVIIEDVEPFVLYASSDGWASIREARALPLPFGLFGVFVDPQPQGTALAFTRKFGRTGGAQPFHCMDLTSSLALRRGTSRGAGPSPAWRAPRSRRGKPTRTRWRDGLSAKETHTAVAACI